MTSFFSAAMIHWIRQIKEVLATQIAYEMVENSGPLDEIEFWNKRFYSFFLFKLFITDTILYNYSLWMRSIHGFIDPLKVY
jgi:hypothetical protein